MKPTLHRRHVQMLRLRYGFDTGEPMTLAEVANVMDDVTRQDIHWMERQAQRRGQGPYLNPRVRGNNTVSSSGFTRCGGGGVAGPLLEIVGGNQRGRGQGTIAMSGHDKMAPGG